MNQNNEILGFCYHEPVIDEYGNLKCHCGKIFVRNMRPMGVYTLD